MKHIKYFKESKNESLCKNISRSDMDQFDNEKKREIVTKSDFNKSYEIINRKDFFFYERPYIIEAIWGYDDNQMVIKKYEDDWWIASINISNGPSYHYLLDTLDGLREVKIDGVGICH